MIDLRGIAVTRDGSDLLQDIGWLTRSGQNWAVLGRNGSGKTTLLSVVLGYVWPTVGRVNVLGNEYGRCDVRAVRRRIGVVGDAMDARLDHSATCLDVVVTGLRGAARLFDPATAAERERAHTALRRVDSAGLAHRRLEDVSQGQRRLVTLARALVADPALLVLDEPCSGLDFVARELVLDHLDELAADRDRQLVLVTHHPEELIAGITHVLVLEAGRIATIGEKMQVMTSATLSDVLGLPVVVSWHDGRPLVRTRRALATRRDDGRNESDG
ncbi:MAG: ATP-binding cassette domain-containing protein [Firmicutes bacterium]|nr:ATP-binding cassette domain-containing protein [Bacillota bacterium]